MSELTRQLAAIMPVPDPSPKAMAAETETLVNPFQNFLDGTLRKTKNQGYNVPPNFLIHG